MANKARMAKSKGQATSNCQAQSSSGSVGRTYGGNSLGCVPDGKIQMSGKMGRREWQSYAF